MVKIGNGVWKLDGTSELAHVLEEFLAERMPINVKLDEAIRIPCMIFTSQVVRGDPASGAPAEDPHESHYLAETRLLFPAT